jgi:hypothetical protein
MAFRATDQFSVLVNGFLGCHSFPPENFLPINHKWSLDFAFIDSLLIRSFRLFYHGDSSSSQDPWLPGILSRWM